MNIGDRDLTIHQSPTILSSNRGGGTTGAGTPPSALLASTANRVYPVVWKITPLFASWISSPSNVLFQQDVLNSKSLVLELGCGISGIIGLALSQMVESFVLTDQDYVMKLLNQNLDENRPSAASTTKGRKSSAKSKRGSAHTSQATDVGNVIAKCLDWETDEVTPSLTGSELIDSFDVVIACDCIYNDALINPLVQTCVDACKLRGDGPEGKPTVCIVAQQLRSAEVFEDWLKAFHKMFSTWRIPDEKLIDGLKTDSGFVLHIGILR